MVKFYNIFLFGGRISDHKIYFAQVIREIETNREIIEDSFTKLLPFHINLK